MHLQKTHYRQNFNALAPIRYAVRLNVRRLHTDLVRIDIRGFTLLPRASWNVCRRRLLSNDVISCAWRHSASVWLAGLELAFLDDEVHRLP
jgi:hypothetical protein